MKVFTREDYLDDKREKIPNTDIKEFEALYHYGGWEIVEWEGLSSFERKFLVSKHKKMTKKL